MAPWRSITCFLLGLLLVVLSNAVPLTEEKRAIDAGLLSAFNLMEQYAAAAYCPDNNNSPNTKITCPPGNCPLVQAANTNTLTEFQNSLKTDVTGYVAVDTTNKLVIVSFRGSASIKNWIGANLDIKMVDTDICNGCKAHSGFWNSWIEARDGILSSVKTAAKANPSFKIAATGHSLGGAIATLAAAELRKAGYTVALYSFGAPRIAAATLSDFISSQPGGNYRVTHYNDPVPNLPPDWLEGYRHISPEYYIDKENGETVGVSNIRTYAGNNNHGGNAGWVLPDIGAHLWYFNTISACFDLLSG